tara:strand:- start:1218 stop:1508 length:291 start_codon:yes stop_codon:yes gene_type:complete
MASWRKRKKKKPVGYVPPKSPSRRDTPWVSVTVRAEHFAMLRELGDYHEASVGKVIGTLATLEFLRTLAQSDPVKAMKLKEEYRNNDRHISQILDI